MRTVRPHKLVLGVLAALLAAQIVGLPLFAGAAGTPTVNWEGYPRYYGPPDIWWVDPATDEGGWQSVRGELYALDVGRGSSVFAVGVRYDTFPAAGTMPWIVRGDDSAALTSETAPAPEGAALRGVSAIDASTAWAVGDAGAIVRWDGAAWTPQTSGVGTSLRSVTFVDANVGWAVGAGGTVLRTTNGGAAWTSLSGAAGADLNAVDSLSSTRAVAVGDAGVVCLISGDTVEKLTANTARDLRAVSFAGPSHGWAVGEGTTFRATTDGGHTWTSQTAPLPTFPIAYDPNTVDAVSVDFSDPRTGIAAGSPEFYWRTFDGGAHWYYEYVKASTIGQLDSSPNGWEIDGVAIRPDDPTKVWIAGWDTATGPAGKAAVGQGTWTITAPTAPAALTVSAIEPGPAVQLGWTDLASDEVTYVVQRSMDSAAGPFSSIATLPADSDSYVDSALTAPDAFTHSWHYRVRCSNRGGDSAFSSVAGVRLDTQAPTTLSNIPSAWQRASYEVTLSASDLKSGVATTQYSFSPTGPMRAYAPFTVATEGLNPVYFRSIDRAGNSESTKTATLRIDKQPPVSDDDAVTTYTLAAEVHITATDTLSGVAASEWRIDGGGFTPGDVATSNDLGHHVLDYRSYDVAGNREQTRTVEFNVAAADGAAPVTTSNIDNAWHRPSFTVTMSVVDSGPVTTHYRVSSGATQTYSAGGFILNTEGVHQVDYWSVDDVGNAEVPKRGQVRIDLSPPLTIADVATPAEGTATVHLLPSDPLSGVDRTVWVLDGGSASGEGTTVVVGGLGSYRSHQLTFASIDDVGNRETTRTVDFVITSPDHQAPATTSNLDDEWHRSFDMTLTVTDDFPGPYTSRYRVGGGAWALYAEGGVPLTGDDGVHTVQYYSVDSAANTEAIQSGTLKLDNTAPETTPTAAFTPTYTRSASITLRAEDGHSGVASTSWWLDGGAEHSGTSFSTSDLGAHSLKFRSVDVAGNRETTKTVGFTVLAPDVTRIEGADRYVVAANMAKTGWYFDDNSWEGVDHVIVACGESGKEADPLAAAGLAGVYRAPVLLVRNSSTIPASTRSIINAIGADSVDASISVHIVGGTASVPKGAATNLGKLANVKHVTRIAGADRYEVTANIAKRMVSVVGTLSIPGVLVICAENPKAFYDALAASPAAYGENMPMLGVRAKSVPSSVYGVLTGPLKDKTAYAVSAPTYIGASYARAGCDERLTYSTNYYTAASQIASKAIDHGWGSATEVGVASKLSDSLSGGTFMGKRGGLFLYTTVTGTLLQSSTSNWVQTHSADIDKGWVFGGAVSVPEKQRENFADLL